MVLPLETNVVYHEDFLSNKRSEELYNYLIEIQNVNQPHRMLVHDKWLDFDFGKLTFLDEELYNEQVFKEEFQGRMAAWPSELLAVKTKVEQLARQEFQVGVCIFYPDGNSGVDYHSDPSAFGDTNCIPSLSLGETRVFSFRHLESQEEFQMELQNGSLVIMGEATQEVYEHALLKNPKYKNGRINITFRKYGF